jgi:alanine racemase
VERLITVGEGGQSIAAARATRGWMPAISVTYTNKEAIRTVAADLWPHDVVLVKGDTETRMEQVARALLADPERDGPRLPRQTPGWEQVRLGLPSRPTWVEIDLDAIAENTRQVKQIIGPEVELMAVLKADAYGHGAVKVSRTVLNNGASLLGVATISEGAVLRDAGITAPVMMLGYTPAWQARDAVLQDLRVTVYDLDIARALDRAAADLNTTVRVHVKVDTGMGRLGVLPDQVEGFVDGLRALRNVDVEGVFTHFSVADSEDKAYTLEQLARFHRVLQRLDENSARPRYVHAANSAGTLSIPEARFNLVRVGIALYGLDRRRKNPYQRASVRPSWKSTVAQVKTLPPGSSIGYGQAYVTRGEERIAVIPVGYADGFRRAPQHWVEVLVKGQRPHRWADLHGPGDSGRDPHPRRTDRGRSGTDRAPGRRAHHRRGRRPLPGDDQLRGGGSDPRARAAGDVRDSLLGGSPNITFGAMAPQARHEPTVESARYNAPAWRARKVRWTCS